MEHSISLELRAINIRGRLTIFKVLEDMGVHLLHGHSTQQLVCPFHDDTKPSARAYENTNKVFCFTCHRLWDPINLVMQSRSLDFPQAVEWMEQRFQIPSPKDNLPLTIQYNLERGTKLQSDSAFYLADYIEQRLIEARFRLGLEKYVRLLTSLDLMSHYLQSKRVSLEEFTATMTKLLTKIPEEGNGSDERIDVHSGS